MSKRGLFVWAMVLFLCGLFDFFSAAAQTKQKAKERSRSPRQLTGFKYPDHLNDKIDELEKEAEQKDPQHPHETPPGKKRWLLIRARDQLGNLGFKVEMTSHTLPNEKEYEQSKTVFPTYFDKKFNDSNIEIRHHPHGQSHYTYNKKEEPEAFQVWVDFANMHLGGGVFGNGFVQEETMFLETPELANVAACDQITRSGNSGGVLEGSPRPMLLKGVHRVIEFQQDDATINVPKDWKTLPYKDDSKHHKDLEHGARRLSDKEAQQIIVLAMAAPNRSSGSPGQWSVDTLRDLFNTFVAGFQLSRDMGFQLSRDVAEGKVGRQGATTPAGRRHAAANPPILINTGGIGTGDFDNNRTVVAVLQVLAARQVGNVNVKLWGYDQDEIENTQHGVAKYVQSIRDAYNNAKPQTIKHLIELTHDTFEKNHPPTYADTRREPPREPRSRHTRP